MIRIIQLTDIHLLEDSNASLKGVNTQTRFEILLKTLKDANWHNANLILLTGDLSQDGSLAAYQRLSEGLADFEGAVYWLPGNHDNPVHLSQGLVGKNIYPEKIVHPNMHWQIVLLDSTYPGKIPGKMRESELDFLQDALNQNKERFTLIALHHQVIELGDPAVDNIRLLNADDVWDIVHNHSKVMVIICGHIHYPADMRENKVEVFLTPSCAFKPNPLIENDLFIEDAPGYRVIDLYEEGRIASEIFYLHDDD